MILTKAVSGLARSGATRSGYPTQQGHKVPLFALSGVARSGATRSNYVSAKPFISVGWWDYAALILSDKPSHYWRLNETTGATAVDQVGGSNGTISGGVTLSQPGALTDGDPAMAFNGTTGKIVTTAGSVPAVWTLELWVNAAIGNVAQRPLFSVNAGAGDQFYFKLFGDVSNRLGVSINYTGGGGTTLIPTEPLGLGSWHHVAFVFPVGLAIRTYVDGVALTQNAALVKPVVGNSATTFEIGAATAWPQYFNGALDDVAIYPAALTAAQIAAHYQAGSTGKYPLQRAWNRSSDDVGILDVSLAKADAINTTPVTISFTARGWVPIEGTDVIVTLGSINNLRREFGGTILSTRHRYVGDKPVWENMLFDAQCIDYTWGLDRRKVSGEYVNASVAAIAASLMTQAPTGYTLQVDPDIGAEIVDEISITEQSLSAAFTQLAKRVGGDFRCDYSKVVQLFYVNSQLSAPTIVNVKHPTLGNIAFARDLSQVITRCLGSFGGSNAVEAIGPGETLIPVQTAAWYLPGGGVVLVGSQRVAYGGLAASGGGSLVGPGAGPTGAPNASLLPGAGVTIGTHDYAVTFKTASGESIPGPRITVPVGLFLPPPLAPTPGTPAPGATGPDPGVHDYAISFTISGGETVPGPRVAASTGLTDPPLTGPTPDAVLAGNGPDDGVHDYAVGFGTATGSTPPGPIGGQITTGTLAPYPFTVTFGAALPSPTFGALPAGSYDYATTLVTSSGETTPSPFATVSLASAFYLIAEPSTPVTLSQVPPPPTGFSGGFPTPVYVSFVTANGETRVGPGATIVAPNGYTIVVSNIPIGPPGTIARYLYTPEYYNNPANPLPTNRTLRYKLTDNTTTTINNYAATEVASTNGDIGPPTNTATIGPGTPTIPILNLPAVSDPRITAKRLYRRVSGAGAFQLVRSFPPSVGQFGLPAPTAGPGTYVGTGAGPLGAGTYYHAITFVTAEGETTLSPSNNVTITNPATNGWIGLFSIPVGAADAGVTARKIYRTAAGGGAFKLLTTINDNTTTSYNDLIADASLGAVAPAMNTTGDRVTALGAGAPAVNTAYLRAVHLSDIPRGSVASGTTARNLYRRSGGAGLRYLTTIWDNSATSYTDTTPNASLGAAAPTVNSATLRQIPLAKIPIGNSLVLARKIYRTPANTGGGTLKLVATIADNVTTDFLDTVNDAALGAAALTVGTAQAAQVQLTAIPLGAAAVTARLIYRTKAGLAQLQLLTTLADNVATAWLDTALDAALGANAPTSDSSLLQQPQGNVLAGSPTLPCASVAAFRAAGGWALVSSQAIRYTGISGNAITGIPASGPGAITATITYNTTVVATALLTGVPASGVGAIRYQILKGDQVNIFVQEDDLDAQAAVRAQLPGSDGIIEDEIVDGRLSYAEGRERCRARLDLLGARDSEGKVGIITVSYVCRDLNTQAGATVTINLGPPINLRGDFLIQRVNVTQFNVPDLHPTYTAEASSLRFSAEEMLRLLRQGAY